MKPLQMVSGWMPNGTLIEYVENNPGANRIGLVSSSSGIVLDYNATYPSYWMWQKVSTTFTRTTRYTQI